MHKQVLKPGLAKHEYIYVFQTFDFYTGKYLEPSVGFTLQAAIYPHHTLVAATWDALSSEALYTHSHTDQNN